jgi:hypothetical protein
MYSPELAFHISEWENMYGRTWRKGEYSLIGEILYFFLEQLKNWQETGNPSLNDLMQIIHFRFVFKTI